MRTPICEIILIPLLIHAPTHHGFSADQTQQVGSAKALALYAPGPQTLLPEQLESYYQFFCTALTWFDEDSWWAKGCRERVAQLSLAIQKRQHGELRAIGKTTLIWVIVTAAIGIAALLTECGPLIRDTFFSKAQPANARQATPKSLHQTPLPTAELQEPEASSNSATPSPEQAAIATPSVRATAPTESPSEH